MKLLSDKPLDGSASSSVDFSYEQLAQNLIELIDVSPRPFTIGLFGKWGTGKSTIIGSLKRKLDKRKYVFVKFDVWKYESDALRRSFLVDFAEQLKGRWPFSKIDDKYIRLLKQRLYTTTQHSEDQFKPNLWSILIPVVFILIAAIIYLIFQEPFVAALSGAVSLVGASALVNYFLNKDHFVQQIFVGEDKVSSPEEFYTEFQKMVQMTKKKTFVIVIDNLDRTQKEKTIELLSTVKTFLNADDTNDNVVFVIASDDKAIKEHIHATYSGNGTNSRFDANEFLKKFFNVTIEIPVFIESEISKYTKNLLNQTEIPEFKNNTDLQQVINYGYSENPREIKQYVNNLAAFYLLLFKGIPNNGLSEDFITDNLNFICKLLIVRDKFDGIYEQMKSLAIKNSLTWSEIEKGLRDSSVSIDPELSEYKTFTGLTGWCQPSDESIAWFFRLRRSTEDQALPGWDLFVNATYQQDYENALKLFQDFKDISALNNQLQTFINSIRLDPVKITPFFSTYIRILLTLDEAKQDKLKGSVDLIFLHTPKFTDLSKIMSVLDLTSIVNRLGGLARPNSFSEFIKVLRKLLVESSRSTAPSLLAESDLIKFIDAIDASAPKLDLLKSSLSTEIAAHHTTEAILGAISNKPSSLRNELVNPTALSAFFSKVQVNDVPTSINQFELIGNFNIASVIAVYLERLTGLLGQVNARSVPEEKRDIIDVAYNTFKSQPTAIQDLKDSDLVSLIAISEMFAGWYGEQPNDKDKEVLVRTLAILSKIPGNTAGTNAQDRFEKFVTQANIDDVIGLISDEEYAEYLNGSQAAIRDRMATYPDQVERLMPYLQAAHIPYVISHMSQKAIDTSDPATYEFQIGLDYRLYPKVLEADQPLASSYILNALSSGVNRFPEIVKNYMNRHFITTEQRQEIKRLVTEYEESLKKDE